MARYICLKCLRHQFTSPVPHKNPWKRSERCKGLFVRFYEAFDIQSWISQQSKEVYLKEPETND